MYVWYEVSKNGTILKWYDIEVVRSLRHPVEAAELLYFMCYCTSWTTVLHELLYFMCYCTSCATVLHVLLYVMNYCTSWTYWTCVLAIQLRNWRSNYKICWACVLDGPSASLLDLCTWRPNYKTLWTCVLDHPSARRVGSVYVTAELLLVSKCSLT